MSVFALARKIAFSVGKRLGATVKQDLKLAEKMAKGSTASTKERIAEIMYDDGVHHDYIKKLIQSSKTPEELVNLRAYLLNKTKTHNLTGREIGQLKTAITNKMKYVDPQQKADFLADLKQNGLDPHSMMELLKEFIH